MPTTCKTCKRDDVGEINALLVANTPRWKILEQFPGVSQGALCRHKSNCIQGLFAEVREQKRAGLLADVDEVKEEIQKVAREFSDNGNVRVQLIARRLDAIEKEAKLTGAYTKEQENQHTTDKIAKQVVDRLLEKGWTGEDAWAFAKAQYPEVERVQ